MPHIQKNMTAASRAADGADIDGAHVHPLGDDRGDEQAHSNADGPDDADGSGPWQVEQLLEGGGGGLKQIDQRGQSSENHRDKEYHQDDWPAGDSADHIGEVDEH